MLDVSAVSMGSKDELLGGKGVLLRLLNEALVAVEDAARLEQTGFNDIAIEPSADSPTGLAEGIGFDMGNWHCGSACCICGDVAMRRQPYFGDASFYIPNEAFYEYDSETINNWFELAIDFSDELQNAGYACSSEMGQLAESVYEGVMSERMENALQSGVFTEAEAAGFKHLTSKNPSRADAAAYIRAVIGKVSEYELNS